MTAEQKQIIETLSALRFIPGSWDKRFIGNVKHKTIEDNLTEAQNEWIYRLLYKYRRQAPKIYLIHYKNPLCCKAPAKFREAPAVQAEIKIETKPTISQTNLPI